MPGEPLTNAAVERAREFLTSPISRETFAQSRVLADDGFVREDRRRLIALPKADAEAFRAGFEAWFDIGDGEPFFVFEEVLAVRGKRGALVRLHLEFASGERGGSHLLVWLFDEPVVKLQRAIAFDPEDVDAAVAELDAIMSRPVADNLAAAPDHGGSDDTVERLRTGPLLSFSDWPVEAVPRAAAGVYSIWDGDDLLYVGMSGRGTDTIERVEEAASTGRPWGLVTRLASHASGRRSGDPFCVYVADLLVLPQLSASEISLIARREMRLDDIVMQYVRDRLTFRFVQTDTGTDALRIEAEARAGALGTAPFLNPAV